MNTFLFAVACLMAHLGVAAAAASSHQQKPWHLPVDASLAQPIPEHESYRDHLSTSWGAQVWSLSSFQSHQQPFPLRHRQEDQRRASTSQKEGKEAKSASNFFGGAAAPGLNWSLSNTNGSIQVDALFPSLAHLDLLRAGVIQDPSIGLNEGLYRWVADEPVWTYTADLTRLCDRIRASRNAAESRQRKYWLYFQGLDTVAQIYLGDEYIGETHNQNKWYAFQIASGLIEHHAASTLAHEGCNTNITLVFNNTERYAADLAQHFDPGYPNQLEIPFRPRTFDYEYPNRIFVRKQQSDFGWDWGPALVPAGPHKHAYLIALPDAADTSLNATGQSEPAEQMQSEVFADTNKPTVVVIASGIDIYRKGQINNLPPPDSNATWIVNVTLTLLSSGEVSLPSLRLSIPSLGLYTFDTLLSSSTVSAGLNEPVHATFEIPSSGKYGPALWWPRGYGSQTMYEVVLHSDELGIQVQKWVGFRTAVFDLSTVSTEEVRQGVQPGSHFRLFINDREVYVMGTNVIPFDTLSPRTNSEYLRWLLDSARYTHVNLIRIWGGGAYPTQELLDLCDELGIMVWQDAMFAASLYPYHDEFLDEVSTELEQVMTDLISHPSIVAVVGNNEGELFFTAYGRLERDDEFKRGYELLFDTVIRNRVKEASRGLSYISCSTTTGYIQLDPYVGRYDNYTKGVELHGTGEHYGYEATKAFDINTYPRSRFMVEFGMFSLASIQTMERILVPDSEDAYSINSTVLRAHLKHPPAANLTYPFPAESGQQELISAITAYFPSPSSTLSQREQLHRYSLFSQLFQALYISNQIAVYRVQAAQRERNRGLIVWQLNDVWEGTSWSSVEYGGRWKWVNYALANVQASLATVAIYNVTDDALRIELVWSGAEDAGMGEEVRVGLEWFDFTGKTLSQEQRKVKLNKTTVAGAITVTTVHNITQAICSDNDGCFLRLTLSSTITPVYWTPMHLLKRTLARLGAENRHAHLELSLVPADDSERAWAVEVRNTGNATAAWVWIEHGAPLGFFAQCREGKEPQGCRPHNGFWVNGGESVSVQFVRAAANSVQEGTADQAEIDEWFAALSVSSVGAD